MFRTEHAGPHPLKAEVTLLRRDRQTEESRKMPSRVAAVRGGWLSSLTNNTREDSEEACGLMLHSPARCHFYWHGWTASKCDKWFKSEVYIQGHSKLFKKKKKKTRSEGSLSCWWQKQTCRVDPSYQTAVTSATQTTCYITEMLLTPTPELVNQILVC